ncbi:MAG: tRNA uridine-5-carboxymethylaminomethyl(34) synthesis GTPase MnmE [Proteobacteria bacterium]|nr:tRNA uridine-5-carboxymethylaminomethyl(34) synthesis GTPase MnmE [Pseudomonadota bacterium]
MSTIFAPSTAPGKAGVAVIRISGARAGEILTILSKKSLPEPRKAVLRHLYTPKTGEIIDNALVLWFPAPHSFTGEDVVELHIHGSRAIQQILLGSLSEQHGLRPAEGGEFTRRAFENGRMDLTQVEGLADLIDADTARQHAQAVRQLSGGLSALLTEWRLELIQLLAHMEAYIDFPDEDLPAELEQEIQEKVRRLRDKVGTYLHDRRGEMIRRGIQVAILGAPNAGKSSLLNWLARREVAIVSHIAGTTRDILEVQLDIDGIAVTVSDTAGLRESSDSIEQEGIRRAKARAGESDLTILLFSAETFPQIDKETAAQKGPHALQVVSKIDLNAGAEPSLPKGFIPLSTHAAITDAFMQALTKELRALAGVDNDILFTRERHRAALTECHTELEACLQSRGREAPIELSSEHIRRAAQAIARIIGTIDTEEILDVLFGSFCIGK